MSVESKIKGDESLRVEVARGRLLSSQHSSKTQPKLLERADFSRDFGLLPTISPFSLSISSTGREVKTVCVVVVVRERWNSVVFLITCALLAFGMCGVVGVMGDEAASDRLRLPVSEDSKRINSTFLRNSVS